MLEFGGGTPDPHTQSRSLVPMMNGMSEIGRDAVIYGAFGHGLCCTDGSWTLMQPPDRSLPLYGYSTQLPLEIGVEEAPTKGYFLPDVEMPQWRFRAQPVGGTSGRPGDTEPMLFHRAEDPAQKHNLIDTHPEEHQRMLSVMRKVVDKVGAPDEMYDRFGLR